MNRYFAVRHKTIGFVLSCFIPLLWLVLLWDSKRIRKGIVINLGASTSAGLFKQSKSQPSIVKILESQGQKPNSKIKQVPVSSMFEVTASDQPSISKQRQPVISIQDQPLPKPTVTINDFPSPSRTTGETFPPTNRFFFPPYFPSISLGSYGFGDKGSLKSGFAAYGISSDINIKTLPTYSRYSSGSNIFKQQAKEDARIQNLFYGKPKRKSKKSKSKRKSVAKKEIKTKVRLFSYD